TELLSPNAKHSFTVDPGKKYSFEAKTAEGVSIEAFSEELSNIGQTYVYNVATASPLVEFTVIYGKSTPPQPRKLGPVRFLLTHPYHVFVDPPQTISVAAGSEGSRTVLRSLDQAPGDLQEWVANPTDAAHVIASHAKWDSPDSNNILDWMSLAGRLDSMPQIL